MPSFRACWWKKFGFRGWDDEAGGVEVVFQGGVGGGEEFCLEAAAGLGDCLGYVSQNTLYQLVEGD